MASGSPHQVDLMQLPLPQLNMLKEQLEQEVEMMQNSLQQLKIAQSKFMESKESLDKIKPENEGKDVLVPLTSSLYVPGQLKDVTSVLIDIGTGYFAEKDITEAQAYFQRKVQFVTKQMDKIQPIMIEKTKMRQVVTEVMNIKIQSQMSSQQTVAAKS